tara:strand:- start:875 stop:2440 length:1566 start_codon:yes stop_codon:yes gene_type:complete
MNEYEYNDEILDREEKEVKEVDLPAIVRNWEKVATGYSRYNNIPAIIGFYSLLGDLAKNMVEIPFGPTSVDTRIHFCWIQTARTGKTTLIMYVLNPVAKEIYKELEDDPYVKSEVLSFADYTTAALVGTYFENKKYIDDEEKIQKIYDDEEVRLSTLLEDEELTQREYLKGLEDAEEKRNNSKERWVIEYGPIHGEGMWFADEFEGSGVFKDKSHKENMNIVFQTLMNNFHNGSNIYHRILTGKPTIPLNSRYTIMACTFPPEHLFKTVAEKGILQRFLPYIWTVPDDIVTEMRREVIQGFGTRSETQGPPLHLKKGVLEIYKLLRRRFEEVEKDKDKTIVYSASAKDVLDMEYDNVLRYIDNLRPEIRNVVRLFEMNLLEYMGKLAVLNSIAMAPSISQEDNRFIVHAQNVRQGAYVVRKCYTALVSWLEDAITDNKKVFKEKSNFKDFQQAYQLALDRAKPQETMEGGYVWKKIFLEEAIKILKVSQATAFRKLDKISELFESKKKGKQAFIKIKKQEE